MFPSISFTLFSILLLVFAAQTSGAQTYQEIKWPDLASDNSSTGSLNTPIHSGSLLDNQKTPDQVRTSLKAFQQSASVNRNFNKKPIKIPGFVVPLELNEKGAITEFFLVPFSGACIHVPPPPTNQIIHVAYSNGYKPRFQSEPVWIYGTIMTQDKDTAIANSGYQLTADKIEPHDGWF